MKFRFLSFICLVLLFVACNDNKDKQKQTSNNDSVEIENVDEPLTDTIQSKNVTDRDYSITKDIAYNDLFLDSMAVENYIEKRQLSDKKISRRIRSFYNARNFQFAWFYTKGLTEPARFFWNQYDYAVSHLKDTTLMNTNSNFYKQAERYINQEKLTAGAKDPSILETELGFTEHFIRYVNSTYEKGFVKRKEREKFIPIRKLDATDMADSLLSKKHSDDKYYEQVNDMYAT